MPIIALTIHRSALVGAIDSAESLISFTRWAVGQFEGVVQITETHLDVHGDYALYLYCTPLNDKTLLTAEVLGAGEGNLLVSKAKPFNKQSAKTS